jgi:hypothetical protein
MKCTHYQAPHYEVFTNLLSSSSVLVSDALLINLFPNTQDFDVNWQLDLESKLSRDFNVFSIGRIRYTPTVLEINIRFLELLTL